MTEQGANWRYAKFYMYVASPISIPTDYAFISTYFNSGTCQQHHRDWLEDLIPANFIERIVTSSSCFVILRFQRSSTVCMPWIKYYFDSELIREKWSFQYTMRGLPPDGMKWWSEQHIDPVQTYGVIVEATTCLPTLGDASLNRVVFEGFERCLGVLESISEAYAEILGDIQTGFVNLATVLPGVPGLLIDPEQRLLREHDIRSNEEGAFPSGTPEDLSPEQMNAVMTIASLAESGAPGIVTQHWRRQAFRARHVLGDFAAAVIFAEIAGEVFFDSLLMSLAWEDQKWSNKTAVDQHVVEAWFRRNASFTWRLRNDRTFAPRLTQGWHMETSGNALYEFERHVTWLRNRIVHGGYRPTGTEAARAFEALDDAISFAVNALLRDCNRNRYPLTAVMQCGIDRLEQRGVYKNKLRDRIESTAPGWRKEFYSFRQTVVANAATI